MKNKKEENNLKNKQDQFNLEEVLEKKRKRKRVIFGVTIVIAIIIITLGIVYNHYYGNKGYIRADVKISSSSKLYSNSEPEDTEDIGEGALFILYVEGIKRDDFLAEFEVEELSINGEKVELNQITYRHLNNALSMRIHSQNYNLEKGNTIVISVKEKNSGQILTRRLYHETEVI
jgi:hypothetical protein